jgi:hypothetical protein
MEGGTGSNSFDCGLALVKSIVLDYNPDNGDTIAGQCKIVNNIGTDTPNVKCCMYILSHAHSYPNVILSHSIGFSSFEHVFLGASRFIYKK